MKMVLHNTNSFSDARINSVGSTLKINHDNGVDTNFDNGTLYIDASEAKVGIGTTSPNAILHTNTSDNVVGRFQSSTDDSKIIIQDDDTTGYHNVRNGYHSFGFDGFTTRSPLFVVSSRFKWCTW